MSGLFPESTEFEQEKKAKNYGDIYEHVKSLHGNQAHFKRLKLPYTSIRIYPYEDHFRFSVGSYFHSQTYETIEEAMKEGLEWTFKKHKESLEKLERALNKL